MHVYVILRADGQLLQPAENQTEQVKSERSNPLRIHSFIHPVTSGSTVCTWWRCGWRQRWNYCSSERTEPHRLSSSARPRAGFPHGTCGWNDRSRVITASRASSRPDACCPLVADREREIIEPIYGIYEHLPLRTSKWCWKSNTVTRYNEMSAAVSHPCQAFL